MFENLQAHLNDAIKHLRGAGQVSDINIAQTLKEIRRALVAADVNYKIAKEVTDKIKEKAIGQKINLSVSPGQYFTKITAAELTTLMGEHHQELSLSTQETSVILVTGLQGSGKTTFCAKLARHLKTKGLRLALIGCDIHRPAAVEQLKVLGDQIQVPVYAPIDFKDAVKSARHALQEARQASAKVVIVDTAGRLSVDEEMMKELLSIKEAVRPHETLFVLDAMTGQDAVETARVFNERIDFDGVVLSKLDGDAKGGAALSVKASTSKPIKFISTGESLDTLDIFHPERMAQRILGMGDVLSLVEKAQQQFDEKEAQKLVKKLRKNTFDLNDFLSQLQKVRKMGKIKDLVAMIPGMSKQMEAIEEDEDLLRQPEIIIHSMTPNERTHPDIIKASRRQRIAKGSGTTITEVNMLLKKYEMARKMMRKASQGAAPQMLQQMLQQQKKTSGL